jgi:hypothetical protein
MIGPRLNSGSVWIRLNNWWPQWKKQHGDKLYAYPKMVEKTLLYLNPVALVVVQLIGLVTHLKKK